MTRSRPVLQAIRPIASAMLAALLAASLVPGPAPTVIAQDQGPVPVADQGQPGDTALAGTRIADPGTAGPTGTGPEPPAAGAAGAAQQQPSIAYEQAMAHEHDPIVFKPGGRVTVGFKPRADDAWPVGGKAPVALPPGRATGRQMAASPEGSDWTSIRGKGKATGDPAGSSAPAVPAPVDAPAGRPFAAAVAAGFTPSPADPAVDLAAASGLRRQVFGFLPYWELSGASTRLNYDVLSTIAYFSVGADASGNLKKRNGDGSRTTGWSGWASSNLTSVISAAHRHGTRVVLTISVFAWTTSQANTQRAILGSAAARLRLARQAAAAVRDRGADGVNLDFEPLARGYESEFVSLLRAVRSELNRVRSGYQLTYDTTGYIGNYPLEASVGSGAADAVFIMGYDYRTASSSTAGSVDPLSGPAYDLADTVRAYTARIRPSRVILGIPWYGRAWSTRTDAPRSRNISGHQYGYSTAVNYEIGGRPGREVRTSLGQQRAEPVHRLPPQELHRDLRLRDQLAAGLLRRRNVDEAPLRAGQRLRFAGCRNVGAGLRRRPCRAVPRGVRLVPGRQVRAPGGDLDPHHHGARRGVHGPLGRQGCQPRGELRRPGLRRRRAVDALADPRQGDLRRVARRGRPRLRVPGARSGQQGQRRHLEHQRHLDLVSGARGRGLRPRQAGRVVVPHRTVHERRHPGRAAQEHDPGHHPGTRAGQRLHVVGGHPADPRVGAGLVRRARGVGRGFVASSAYVVPYRAPNSTTVDAGLRGLDFGPGGASGVGGSVASVARRALSPDGDGSGDILRLRWTNTLALDSLALNVYRTNGKLVGSRTVSDRGKGAQTWDWNGRAGAGVVPDGRYVLQLVGKVGRKAYHAPAARPVTGAQVAAYAVTVDTVAPRLSAASASRTLFSPNGDGQKDTVRLALSATGATRWAVRIANGRGSIVRTVTGSGRSFGFTWNGTADAGSRVPDGRYTATLLAYDDAGNSVRRAYRLSVDTTPPKVTPTVSEPVFSPDGDRATDTTRLSWAADTTVWGTARVWKGSRLIRSWTVTGRTSGSVAWDGRTTGGSRVADGRYTFRVDVRDAARNATSISKTVVVDRTAGFLRWSGSFYPQDGDSLERTARLSWSQTRQARTTLRIYDAAGHTVRTVWTGRTLGSGTRGWTWNGRLANGSYVPQGRYLASLTVTSSLGTTELRRTVWVSAFSVSASPGTVRAGQRLTVTFRSVERLATGPRVSFSQPGQSTATVRATRLANGSYRAVFTVRRGAAGTATVRISARDAGGHRNATSVQVRVAS